MNSIEERLQELREISARFAKAKAQTDYLDHFRKSKLAILKKNYALLKAGAKFLYATDASQEREARADPEYLAVLEGLRDAMEESQRLYWELKIAQMGCEIWRSKQATRREEMKLT
jgi:hypothetical protein